MIAKRPTAPATTPVEASLPEPLPALREGMDSESLKEGSCATSSSRSASFLVTWTASEPYLSVALAVRDRLMERWIRTQDAYYESDAKRVYYLSLEFLMGRTLGNSLINLDLVDPCRQALEELGYDFEKIREAEWDAGLGNGGLGRLAACFLDSLATLELPSYGYGIRYDYGIFHQRITNGAQVETPDGWLRYGNPWEIARTGDQFRVRFGGRVHQYVNDAGRLTTDWLDTEDVLAVPYDTPIPGYRNDTVNTLRLWSARATEEFQLDYFNEGDYLRAVEEKAASENITKVLYPNDSVSAGRELRLRQEYFFVTATLQDIVRRYKKHYLLYDDQKGLRPFDRFVERTAIQLNDTHPALAIPELMRILVDAEGLGWDEAWTLTTAVFGYTNHTVLPEALERWPVALFGRLLPRHLQIIYEINQRFLDLVRREGDDARCRRMSIIEEDGEKRVRMAHLAIVGSHSVNGVAALHSEILKRELFRDFHELWPEKIQQQDERHHPAPLAQEGEPPALRADHGRDRRPVGERPLGPEAPRPPGRGPRLRPGVAGGEARQQGAPRPDHRRAVRPPGHSPRGRSRLDVRRAGQAHPRVQAAAPERPPRGHALQPHQGRPEGERTCRGPSSSRGKAAPAYRTAKLIIRLVNAVGDVVNRDPDAKDLLKVVFLADYRVSLAEQFFPAAELSEQISTAGTEASGTGNMKFALNGALTIGTMDGATIEIAEEVGAENIFVFGLRADEVAALQGRYRPRDYYEGNPELRRVLDMIGSGAFSPEQPDLFRPLVGSLLDEDRYLLLADYASYVDRQRDVDAAYREPARWTGMAIRNVAGMGKFSTDRTISEYAREIWGVEPVSPLRTGGSSR